MCILKPCQLSATVALMLAFFWAFLDLFTDFFLRIFKQVWESHVRQQMFVVFEDFYGQNKRKPAWFR